ncbi:hypothetical protein ACIA8K_07915 [Catenuloplanes sp. NPDC051500]|uniref:hypothetical protein n=1 Tax=Catenuloplanes sp. NPDC051500 TaxID=3363959 RepID=UPI0037A94526
MTTFSFLSFCGTLALLPGRAVPGCDVTLPAWLPPLPPRPSDSLASGRRRRRAFRAGLPGFPGAIARVAS